MEKRRAFPPDACNGIDEIRRKGDYFFVLIAGCLIMQAHEG